jgi:hypothetical protein
MQSGLRRQNRLEALYAVHGTGTSGEALGGSFDIEINPASPSAVLDLKPGGWDIDVTVWNNDVTSVAVGSGAATITVLSATPQTVSITCLPYSGPGDLVIDLEWFPDVVVTPSAEAEVKALGGSVIPVPLTLTSSVTADGTASLEQGWYTGALRIFDNEILSAGVVRTLRIASGMITTWSEYLIVSALEAIITIDVSYDPGPPLIPLSNTPEGDLVMYTDQTHNITIDPETEHDSGTTLVYAWYLNGILTALSTSNTFDVIGNNHVTNTSYYLSAIVFQSNGYRAGDLQWKIIKVDLGAGQLAITGTVTIPDEGGLWYVDAIDADGTTIVAQSPAISMLLGDTSFTYDLGDVPIGVYYLKTWKDNDWSGIHEMDEPRFAYFGNVSKVRPPDFPANVTIPHDVGVTLDITVLP